MPLLSDYIFPDWPAPSIVRAVTTTRHSGYSQPPYDSFNLAGHVGDDHSTLHKNRAQLMQDLPLPREPCWLHQVHGVYPLLLDHDPEPYPTADASYTHLPNRVCAVLTADCLPILLCDMLQGTEVAVIHAGWKGLLSGVIKTTLAAMQTPRSRLIAWLGPAIGPQAFQVNDEMRSAFMTQSHDAKAAFAQHGSDWYGDLYQLAKLDLHRLGVHAIYGGHFCTYTDEQRFFSYRRAQGGPTGRMATLIWIDLDKKGTL
ncbi:MAG: hypothetical protein A3F41_01025 [Coxiella sp. RIFCSPHIGHO2_12_FULL_44_14]|nr:MAG: hypothetical protein A3F41_01025 [Coxiella sp. RIFCSPHIGHO2_12_FULL_44_14]